VNQSVYSNGDYPVLLEPDDTEELEGEDDELIIYEFKELLTAMKAGEETTMPVVKQPMVLRKSSQKMVRPVRASKENQCFVTLVKINGQSTVALLDSGCTMDAISPKLTKVTKIKVHKLMEQVPLQLGTSGSRSKINYGVHTNIVYGSVDTNHYFNVININRYDAVLGTLFMRKHGIVLDFELDQV
jgi:hypothetical protein